MGAHQQDDFSHAWYNKLYSIATCQDLSKRYYQLEALHAATFESYISNLKAITEKDAESIGSDGRLVKIVVAHILAWEEWQLQVFSDGLNRESHLKEQMQFRGYVDPETGQTYDFGSVDNFNAFQTAKYKTWAWKDIQKKAIATALKLKEFFPTNPAADWISFLDSSPSRTWRLSPQYTIIVPQGWYLWMVSLKHEAVEHRQDFICKSYHDGRSRRK